MDPKQIGLLRVWASAKGLVTWRTADGVLHMGYISDVSCVRVSRDQHTGAFGVCSDKRGRTVHVSFEECISALVDVIPKRGPDTLPF